MKRKDILISLAIILTSLGVLYLYTFTSSLVHGYIQLESGNANAFLKLGGNFFSKGVEVSGSEPVKINSKVLRPRYLQISKTLDDKTIKLTSYGPWGDFSRIKIKNNETLSLKVGPPLLIKPDIKKQGNTVSVGFSVYGQGGERYSIPRLPKTPKIKIMDEHGNNLISGSFSYG